MLDDADIVLLNSSLASDEADIVVVYSQIILIS